MSHHVIEFDHICPSCKGKGLYVGLAERDGSAVVCHTCKGTGCKHTRIEYDDFEGRIESTDVTRVIKCNPGICVGTGKDGQLQLSDFGGQSYEDWKAGKRFPSGSEMRRFTCPAWWYQTANYDLKPHWDECLGCGVFSNCEHFATKDECWARWDEEFGQEI